MRDDLLLERLLQVIDEGRRTATYKLALLSAVPPEVVTSVSRQMRTHVARPT